MRDQQTSQRFDVIVIGGGQAGLAAGNELERLGLHYVILDANARVGDAWRNRWDSLRLFTPARMSSLPGLPFPAPPTSYPGKDAVADYLATYAVSKGLPVLNGLRVDDLRAADDGRGYTVRTGERSFRADQVVVATGAYDTPDLPAFAAELDPAVRQLHSRDYRNPDQLQDGPVLVVGGANTGAEIALDIVRGHRTILSGRNPGEMPFGADRRLDPVLDTVMFWAAKHLLTRRNPIARRQIAAIIAHGTPVERAKLARQRAAGIERVFARTVGVRDGQPLLDDGTVVEVGNVVWATGFRPEFSWIRLPIVGDDGWPMQRRGVIASAPGLYVLGLPFMDSLASALIGGVARDAAHLAKRIAAHARTRERGHSVRVPVHAPASARRG